jgi:ABC-type glycerol-3-phosphate transport system permease component
MRRPTLVVYVYRLAFENFEFGYASAMGVVWLVLLMGFALAYLRALKSQMKPARHAAGVALALALAWSLAPVYWMLGHVVQVRARGGAARSHVVAARRRRSTTTAVSPGGTLPFVTFFANTVITCLATAVVAVLIALPAAYALSRARFRLRGSVAYGILGVAHAAAGRAARAALPAPAARASARFAPGLVVGFTTFGLPFAVWMLKTFIDAVPIEIEERRASTATRAGRSCCAWWCR